VPPAQSRHLTTALDKAGVKNQLIMVDAGHDGPLFSTPEVESKVVAYLKEVFAESNSQTPKSRN